MKREINVEQYVIYKAINTDLRWGGVVLLKWEGNVESQVKKNGTKKKKRMVQEDKFSFLTLCKK